MTPIGFHTTYKTLGKLATIGGGPKFQKFGTKSALYAIEDLDEWATKRLSPAFKSTETEFIEKCADYLRQDYVSIAKRDAFVENLTPREERALYSFGGISTLWSICHPNGTFNPDRFDFKLKALRDVFRSTAILEQKRLPDIDTKRVKQIKRIISSALKRIT